MRPVPVFPDYLVKLVIPPSLAILKPAVIYRFVSLAISPFSGGLLRGYRDSLLETTQETVTIAAHCSQ